MNYTILFFGLIFILLGGLIIYHNPDPLIVSLGLIEIEATKGVSCVATFGLGLLTGIIAVLTRDVPRWRRLRALDQGSDE